MILGLSSADGGMTVGLCRHLTVVGLHDTGPLVCREGELSVVCREGQLFLACREGELFLVCRDGELSVICRD